MSTYLSTRDDERTAPRDHRRPKRVLRPVLWRLHFFAGFLIAPIVVWMAATGIAYAWNTQIEAVLYHQAFTPISTAPDRPLSQQVRAAAATHPRYQVTAITPAARSAPSGEKTTAVTLSPPHPDTNRFGQDAGVTTVYVDPGSARVTGHIMEANRPDEWIRNLHSNWRVGQGSWIEPLSELAASWALVSLATGVYLWRPRLRRRRAGARRPRLPRRGRPRWRTLHTSAGLVLLVPLLAVVGTGLTWTNFAGRWVDVAESALSAQQPRLHTDLPATSRSHTAGTGAAPASTGTPASLRLANIDRMAAAARGAGVARPLVITPPGQPDSAWQVASVDERWPIQRSTVAVAPATGQVTDRITWADQPLLAKATTLGILYHQGDLFGLANQVGLTVMAAALLTLIAAGYLMWWRRRPAAALGAPPRMRPLLRAVPIPLLAGFAALMVLIPTLGVSFVVFLLAERFIHTLRAMKR